MKETLLKIQVFECYSCSKRSEISLEGKSQFPWYFDNEKYENIAKIPDPIN